MTGTCSFTPGSCSLTAWRLTSQGFQWAKTNKDLSNPTPSGYKPEFAEKAQLLLSDIFLGFFMVPEGGLWNYHFMGSKMRADMKYNLVLETPHEFHHEIHRPQHFLTFTESMNQQEQVQEADREDHFS